MLLLAADNPIDHVTDKILLKAGDVPILTQHMVTIVVVAALFVWAMMVAARSIATGPESEGNERYLAKGRFAQMIEAIVSYLRDEMLEPVLGAANTRRYLPFLMTLFFFILFQNLFGLVPIVDLLHITHLDGVLGGTVIGGTATANIMVTGALALVAFVVIQVHGFRELGIGGYVDHLTGGLAQGPLTQTIMLAPVIAIVFVVEIAGQFIKPTALAVRLFANMVAGHTLMAVLYGFGKMAADGGAGLAGVAGVTLVGVMAAVAISFLELFVAFLQAFIFMFLTAVFISLLSHHDEHHEEDHAHEPSPADVGEPIAA